MKKIILAFTVSICLASLQAATVEITQRPNAAENHQLTFWELIYQNPLPDLPSYKNKEGVLLWGRIGAGKTTSAHYLAGAGFKRGEAQSVTPQNPNIKKEISQKELRDKTRMFCTTPYHNPGNNLQWH